MERSTETAMALMAVAIQSLKEHQVLQDEKISALTKERDGALRWGVVALGSMVLALVGAIVSFAKDHWK